MNFFLHKTNTHEQRFTKLSLAFLIIFCTLTQKASAQAGITWATQTSAADDAWLGITYGNGLFVAVDGNGGGNKIMTSPNGITWTQRTSPANNQWSSVTYNGSLFVAVAETGTGNRVMTSPDGITWTLRTSAADNVWTGLTYGGGLFVAVGAAVPGTQVMTSPDGINWTSRATPTGSLYSVTYNGSLFVAVGSNTVMTSPDGITWTARTAAAGNAWKSVTYANSLFVAVALTGTGNRVMTSPDGITWTIRSSAADNSWSGVTYGSGLFVAVAYSGTGNRVMTSPDGITWTTRASAADNDWTAITYANGTFVSVAQTGTGNRVMTSSTPATGLNFDGVNDYVDCGNILTASYTKEAWINTNNLSAANNILSGGGAAGDQAFWIPGSKLSAEHNGSVLSDPTSLLVNTWYHVAVTYDAPTTTMKLYKNGVMVASSTTMPAYSGGNGIYLGSFTPAANSFSGSIDEARVWSRALAQSEIQNNMNCSLSPVNQTGLKALYHLDQGIVSANNSAVTSVTDASGNNNNGIATNFTLTGAASNWVTGTVSATACAAAATGLNFDGVNDYVDCGANTMLNLTSSLSVEAWIKRSIAGTDDCIIGKDVFANGTGYAFWVYQNNKLVLRFSNREYSSASTIAANVWTHVAATYDAATSTLKLYINGILDATFTSVAVPVSNTANLYLGTPQDAVANASFAFSGSMDEVRIWNRALAQTEIQNNMNCEMNPAAQTGLLALYHLNQGIVNANNTGITTATDAGVNSFTGTLNGFILTGATSNWAAGNATGNCSLAATSLNFDGIDDRVQLPAPIVGNLNNFTVEAWVKWAGSTNSAIYSEGFTGSLNQMFSLIPDLGNAGKFEIVLRNAAGTGLVVQYSVGAVVLNTWTHVAFTRTSATTAKLYINGVNTDNFTFTDPGTFPLNVANIGVRQRSSFDSYFGGSIDEVRIWNRTLCQQEIQNNMNTQLNAAAQSGLKAYYKFNHGNVGVNNAGIITATDSSGNNSNATLTNFALTGVTSNWNAGNITGTATTYIPATLAGTAGGAQVSQTGNVNIAGTYFIENGCGLIAKVLPSGVSPVSGSIVNKVKIDATVLTYGGKPYVQRHYDIEPATNASTATATVTLYFTQAEFTAYNTARGALPALPTSAADAGGIANMRITQYHGTGTAPGNYTGTALMIDPVNSNIIYNATLSRWEVTIDVSGFSGFYVHTNSTAGPLPLTLLSFTGKNNGSTKLLEWSTSNEINIKEFVLERSTDNSNFKDVVTVAGKGAITNAYAYNDTYNLDGTVYYRLRIIDNGGRITYSNTVSLNNRKTIAINIFPNPVADKTTLQVTDKKLVGTTATIVDAAGKTVQTFIINSNTVTIDMSRLSAGLYLLRTTNGETQKIIKE